MKTQLNKGTDMNSPLSANIARIMGEKGYKEIRAEYSRCGKFVYLDPVEFWSGEENENIKRGESYHSVLLDLLWEFVNKNKDFKVWFRKRISGELVFSTEGGAGDPVVTHGNDHFLLCSLFVMFSH